MKTPFPIIVELEAAAEQVDRQTFAMLTDAMPRRALCDLIGINYRTLSRYRSGALPIPRWLAIIVLLLAERFDPSCREQPMS